MLNSTGSLFHGPSSTHLEQIVSRDESGQFCERPPPASAEADEKRVPAGRGAENAVDPGNVLNGVVEHDKRHWSLAHSIVLFQVVFHRLQIRAIDINPPYYLHQ